MCTYVQKYSSVDIKQLHYGLQINGLPEKKIEITKKTEVSKS